MKIRKLGITLKYVANGLLYAVFTLFLLKGLVSRAEAKVVYYGSGAEQVRIKHGGPTIFRFPKAVQTITGASRLQIKPANEADPTYTVLAVTPRFTNGINEVAFFLNNGEVVRTKIVVSPNDPTADGLYDFKAHDALDQGGMDQGAENSPVITEVELLKAMVRDDQVAGYKVMRVSDAVPSKEGSVEAELIRIYRGSPFNGYVYRLTNKSGRKKVDIDVRHITVGEPNLGVLSQSDEAILFPKGKGAYQTLLRIVAKNTSSSRDVILPMETEKESSANSKKEN